MAKNLHDVIERLKAEGHLTRNSGTNSLKSLKESIVSGQNEAAERIVASQNDIEAGKSTLTGEALERRKEDVARSEELNATLERLADSVNKAMGSSSTSAQKKDSGMFGGIGGRVADILGLGALGVGAAAAGKGLFTLGVGITGFLGGLVAGNEILGITQKWWDIDYDFTNIKKGVKGFVDIFTGFKFEELLVIGGAAGLAAFGGTNVAKGLATLGLAIPAFIGALSASDYFLDFIGAPMEFDTIKKGLVGFADIFSGMNEQTLLALGGVLAGGVAIGKLGGGAAMAKGLAGLGLGLVGFFGALAAGDYALAEVNKVVGGEINMSNMKTAVTGFASIFGDMTEDNLKALGIALGGAAAIGVVLGPGKAAKAGVGMTAIALGLSGFFASLGAGEWALDKLGADGSTLKNIMINVAEGIGAFSGESLTSIATLLGAGALFGTFGGPVAAGAAALGMSAIGAGLGGFFTGLGIGDWALSAMGADGSSLRDIMKNTAEGIGSFTQVSDLDLIKLSAGLAALGPAMLALLGSDGIRGIFQGAGEAVGAGWDKIKSFFGSEAGEDLGIGDRIAQMVKPFGDIQPQAVDNIDVISEALLKLSEAMVKISDVDMDDFSDNMKMMNALMPSVAQTTLQSNLQGNTNRLAAIIDQTVGVSTADVEKGVAQTIGQQASAIVNAESAIITSKAAQGSQPIVINQSTGGNSANVDSSSTQINMSTGFGYDTAGAAALPSR